MTINQDFANISPRTRWVVRRHYRNLRGWLNVREARTIASSYAAGAAAHARMVRYYGEEA